MPSKQQLPDGPHREFVEELFAHFREAGRPTLRDIASWIAQANEDEKTEMPGTASVETIRRVMLGATIPRRWPTVEAIFLALCGIAGRDPEQDRWDDYESESFKPFLKRKWNEALDDEEQLRTLPPPPRPKPPTTWPEPDPWSTTTSSSFDDEPPF
jgi:hypothetical protein